MPLGGGRKCSRCGKTVYAAEEIKTNSFSYHKLCHRCFLCDTGLDSKTVSPHDDELYCKKCHARKFGIKGIGFGIGGGALGMDEGEQLGNVPDPSLRGAPAIAAAYAHSDLTGVSGTGGDRCPRCGGSVYAAEKKIGANNTWHSKCFTCFMCNKRLDSTTLADKDGEIFCKGCYGKGFGPKGVGFGGGSGALATE
ncbi:cysteine and glycine-rich protein 1-like isoform X1 [Lytechinus pictus]|uniref:cysteine and glycine-rich protein 1-like isoform X1 n=1 Tax=Lytechinus pictus TaxID=7653 RepID=UPI00240DB2A0|nr:cysteine and glycine-rich protein 1-like isoform X1 [Lytechinus pictus]